VATAGGADLSSNPIRLSKGRISAVLGCERHLALTVDDRPDSEALHIGVLIDLLAERHVVSGRDEPVPDSFAVALELCEARHGADSSTLAFVAGLEASELADLAARVDEKQRRLLAGWPAFAGRWWARTQERMTVGLADGEVVLSGAADVTLGGRPTPWPVLVVEVKSGSFTIDQRDDGLVYALLLALRDGVAPAAAVTVTASGEIHVDAATPDRLATAARRVSAAITAAGELAGGRPPVERAGTRCRSCPAARTCATAASAAAASSASGSASGSGSTDRVRR
jgi:hypothetical protein